MSEEQRPGMPDGRADAQQMRVKQRPEMPDGRADAQQTRVSFHLSAQQDPRPRSQATCVPGARPGRVQLCSSDSAARC